MTATRMAARASVLAALLFIAPRASQACAKCFGASDTKVLRTYLLSGVMLSLLPIALLAFIGWMVRRLLAPTEPGPGGVES